MATPFGVGRPRRSWPQRLLIGLNIFVALAVIGAASGYAYLRWRFGQIHKIHIAQLAPDDPGQTMNVLLVGSDSRARTTGLEAQQTGKDKVGGERSDTIMVLHVDPRETKATILSLPRDLYLKIAGTDRMDRINSAIGSGGQSRLTATIQQNLGIRINHYVEVDFVGFRSIVDAVGGVTMYVPAPARDSMSGVDIKSPGCVKFDGTAALAWARSRHYTYFEAGRWREDPRGDLGRIQRQQELIRRMMKKAISSASGGLNILQLNRLIGIGIKNVTIDSSMSRGDILRLAKRFRSLDPDSVDMLTLPVTNGTARIGGGTASILRIQQPDAQEFIDRVNGYSASARSSSSGSRLPSTIKPGEVRLRVLNGTGADALASRVSTDLQSAGFGIAGSGDADSFRYERTVIRYEPSQLARAQLLQSYLPGGAQLKPAPELRTVGIELVVGANYSGVRSPSSADPNATTTTVPKPSPVPSSRGGPAQPSC